MDKGLFELSAITELAALSLDVYGGSDRPALPAGWTVFFSMYPKLQIILVAAILKTLIYKAFHHA